MIKALLAVSPNGLVPQCEHLDGLESVTPGSERCQICGLRGTLLVCLTCGWVACSDDCPDRHARAHYEETDHPVARGLGPEAGRRWCYVHERFV